MANWWDQLTDDSAKGATATLPAQQEQPPSSNNWWENLTDESQQPQAASDNPAAAVDQNTAAAYNVPPEQQAAPIAPAAPPQPVAPPQAAAPAPAPEQPLPRSYFNAALPHGLIVPEYDQPLENRLNIALDRLKATHEAGVLSDDEYDKIAKRTIDYYGGQIRDQRKAAEQQRLSSPDIIPQQALDQKLADAQALPDGPQKTKLLREHAEAVAATAQYNADARKAAERGITPIQQRETQQPSEVFAAEMPFYMRGGMGAARELGQAIAGPAISPEMQQQFGEQGKLDALYAREGGPLKEQLEGATKTLATIGYMRALGIPIVPGFTAQIINQTYNADKEAGHSDLVSAGHAIGTGGLQAALMTIAGKIGQELGVHPREELLQEWAEKAQSLLTKEGAIHAVKDVAFQAGEGAAIHIAQSAFDSVTGIDPNATDAERLLKSTGRAALDWAVLGGVGTVAGEAMRRTSDAYNRVLGQWPKVVEQTIEQHQQKAAPPTFDVSAAEKWAADNPNAAAAMASHVANGGTISRGYLEKVGVPAAGRSNAAMRSEFGQRVSQALDTLAGNRQPPAENVAIPPEQQQQQPPATGQTQTQASEPFVGLSDTWQRLPAGTQVPDHPGIEVRDEGANGVLVRRAQPDVEATPFANKPLTEMTRGELLDTAEKVGVKKGRLYNNTKLRERIAQRMTEQPSTPNPESEVIPSVEASKQAEETGQEAEGQQRQQEKLQGQDVLNVPAPEAEQPEQSAATEPTESPAAASSLSKKAERQKGLKKWNLLGKNGDGQDVYEDQNGVRSTLDNGIRQTESVGMRPIQGGIVPEIDLSRRGNEYKTTDEVAAEKPPAAPTVVHEQVQKALDSFRKFNDDHTIELTEPASDPERDAQRFLADRGKLGIFFRSEKPNLQAVGVNFADSNFGKDLIFVRSGLNEDRLWGVVGHELAHATGFDKGSQADESLIGEMMQQRLAKASPKYREKMEADPDLARREGVAELAGHFMSDAAFREKVQQSNPSLFERLRDAILKLVGKFTPRDEAAREALQWLRDSKAGPEKKINPKPPEAPPKQLGEMSAAELKAQILRKMRGESEPERTAPKKINPRLEAPSSTPAVSKAQKFADLFKKKLDDGGLVLSEEQPAQASRDPELEDLAAEMVAEHVIGGGRSFRDFVGEMSKYMPTDHLGKAENYLRHAWDIVRQGFPDAKMDSSSPLADILGAPNGESQNESERGDRPLRPDSQGEEQGSQDLAGKPPESPQGTDSENAGRGSAGRGDKLHPDETQPDEQGREPDNGRQRGHEGVGDPSRHGGISGVRAGNFKLTDDVQVGGARGFEKKTRYRANVDAIRTLKQLEAEDRGATPEEQKILAQFVGWGGLKELFNPRGAKKEWTREAAELKELLTPEEYKAAARSIQNAHYTSPKVVKAIWDGVKALGFRGGRITEPGMGTGLFFSLMPDSVRDHTDTRLMGVELDNVTGRIAKKLFPDADIRNEGYQEVEVPDNSVDLHISNVPFAKVKVYDRNDPDLMHGASLHDFYFDKAIKKTRPGGLVVFITSKDSLDEVSSADRKRWREMGGDLVGVVRLPSDTFKGIADTSVVTDVVVFQKRVPGAEPGGEDFLAQKKLAQKGYLGFTDESRKPTRFEEETNFPVNEYFSKHPEHVAGELAWTGTMYGKGSLNVERGNVDVEQRIRDVFHEIADRVDKNALADGGVTVDMQTPKAGETADWPEDWVKVEGDHVYIREDGEKKEIAVPYGKHEKDEKGNITKIATSPTAAQRYQGLADVFEAAEKLVHLQPNPRATDGEVEDARAELNKTYDAFVKKYGPLSSGRNRTYAGQSITMLSRLLSIENYDPDTESASKTAIFNRRTERPRVAPTSADNPDDALRYSMIYRGGVDLPYIEQLTGRSGDEIMQELGPRVYRDPGTGDWETNEKYLSGKVRDKLAAAKEAAKKDPQYQRNVEALEKAQPEDKPISKIGVRLGSTWIPETDYNDWYEQAFHRDITFRRAPSDNTWVLTGEPRSPNEREGVDFGTDDRPAYDLVERYLNNRDVTVRRKTSDGDTYVDREATAGALAKLEKLKSHFADWLWKDPKRADRLHRYYNDNYNNVRDTDWDGSHLNFPGMSDEWRERLNPHQTGAAWRYLQTGNTLLAHLVGAGKTATMAGMAMEAKRLSGNPHYKTLIVVPNHLITGGQFQKEFLEVYPSAKLLAASPKMLSGKGRRTFLKRIAAENYDAVVMAESSFSRIPLDPEYEREFIQKHVDDLERELIEAHKDDDRNYAKELEAQKQRLEEKLTKLNTDMNRDKNSVYFDDLGVDAMFVDEAHEFKNLQVRTRMSRVPGVSTAFSARAFDMLMKSRYFNEKSNYRGLVMATGTPVSNALGELYVMQQYLQPQVLESLGINSFDAWAANFADTVTKPEIDPAGGGMRMHTRLAKYRNINELMGMFRQVADVKLLKQLKDILKRPPIVGGKPTRVDVERNPYLEAYTELLQNRARQVRQGSVDPTQDNMLKITGDGRKAALDMRLVDPSAPDMADSKVNKAVENVHRIWQDTADKKSTQIMWLDVTSPENKQPGQLDLYREIVDKLVAKGVPRDEIAIMHDFKNEDAKAAMYAKMNRGDIRVLLASTATGGTGLNVQKVLIANHHLDPPYRPSDVEQRDGRILRRGNTNSDGVHIFQYVAKGSFDAFMWDMLERKSGFINQALGGGGADELEEDNGELTAAEMKAAASDNPHLMEFVKTDADVRRLEMERQSHLDEQQGVRQKIQNAEFSQDYHGKESEKFARFADKYQQFEDSLGDDELRAQIDKKKFTTRKEFGDALMDKVEEAKASMTDVPFTLNGVDGIIHANINWRKEKEALVQLHDGSLNIGHADMGDSASGNVTRLQNLISKARDLPEYHRQQSEQNKARLSALKERLGKPFEKAPELEKATLRRGELFNLTQRDSAVENQAIAELNRTTGRKVVVTDSGKYIFDDDGQPVPEDKKNAAVENAQRIRTQQRIAELDQLKRNVVPYEWTRPPRPPATGRRGLKKKGGDAGEIHGFGAGTVRGRRVDSGRAGSTPRRPERREPVTTLERALYGDRGFVSRDVLPTAAGILGTLREAGDQVMRVVAPHMRGLKASRTAKDLRELGGTVRRFYDMTEHAYRDASHYFASQPDDENIERILKAQTGKLVPDGTPGTDMQIQFDKDFESDRRELEQVKPGVTAGFGEWYFPQEWENENKAISFLQEWMRKRPLEGSKGFLKRRVFPTVADGIEAGLKLRTTNLADLALNKRVQIRRYVEANRMVNDKLIPDHRAVYFSVNQRKAVPKDWVQLEDPMFTKYGPPTVAFQEYVDENVYNKLSKVAGNLGIRHTRQHSAGRGKLGWSQDGVGNIVTQSATELSVVAHEIGHQLDDKYGLRGIFGLEDRKQGGKLSRELRNIADLRFEGKNPDEVSKHARAYTRKSAEKMAQVVEAYVHAPERMKEVAPQTYRKFKQFIDSHAELAPLRDIKQSLALKKIDFEKPHGGLLVMGHYYAPEEVATVVNNYMSKSLESQSSLFAGLQGASRLQTMFNLGLSAFHGLMTARQGAATELSLAFKSARAGDALGTVSHLVSTPAAPIIDLWQGRKLQQAWVDPKTASPEYQIAADAFQRSGARALGDRRDAQHFSKAVVDELKHGNWTGATLRLPAATIEQAARPIMEQMVPKMKMGAAYRMLQFEFDRHPNMSVDEIRDRGTEILNSVDNRMGQVVQDNTMTRGWMRSLQNFLFRAFQYQAGTLREYGGAAIDTAKQAAGLAKGEAPEITHKMAYALADATIGAVVGGTMMYLLTGKKPENVKDLFFPQDGGTDRDGNPTRWRIPGYINDLVSWWHSPVTAFEHKMNPFISEVAQLIHNKDYYGEQIYGPEGQGLGRYLAKQGIPFSAQNLMKMREQGEPATSQIAATLGIGPAPGYLVKSKAQNVADQIRHEDSGGPPITHAQAERFRTRHQLTEAVRERGPGAASAAVKEALDAGTITQSDVQDITKGGSASSLEKSVKGFTPAQAMRVWADGSPTDDEKKRLYPIIWGKIERSETLSDDERQKLLDQLGPPPDGVELPKLKERGDVVGKLIYQATEPPPHKKLGEKIDRYRQRVKDYEAGVANAQKTLAAIGATDPNELRTAIRKEQHRRGLPTAEMGDSGKPTAFGNRLHRVRARASSQ
jgi:N12 class adenine-specific DNA methylase